MTRKRRPSKRARSEAAKRGWDTRRRRELERERERARRSAAAKRGWYTRRQREHPPTKVAAPPRPRPPREEPEGEIAADEWEIGFEYRGADRGSYVDVNFRIARDDGAAFGVNEARYVMQAFRERLARDVDPVPPGYVMAWIDWRRPRHRSEGWVGSDDTTDLESFRNVMYYNKDNDAAWSGPVPVARFGSVKP
jgi:hypothetical protein